MPYTGFDRDALTFEKICILGDSSEITSSVTLFNTIDATLL